jgi:predicted negative regulator of RcsB-dependent stress response
MVEEKTPQQQIKEAIWTYTGWVVVVLVCIGAGVFIGYTLWGDAPQLREEAARLEKRVNELKNEREALNTQMAMTTRDRDECRDTLRKLGSPSPAAKAAPAGEEQGP